MVHYVSLGREGSASAVGTAKAPGGPLRGRQSKQPRAVKVNNQTITEEHERNTHELARRPSGISSLIRLHYFCLVVLQDAGLFPPGRKRVLQDVAASSKTQRPSLTMNRLGFASPGTQNRRNRAPLWRYASPSTQNYPKTPLSLRTQERNES